MSEFSDSPKDDRVRDGAEKAPATPNIPDTENLSPGGIAAMQGRQEPDALNTRAMSNEVSILKPRPSDFMSPAGISAMQGEVDTTEPAPQPVKE